MAHIRRIRNTALAVRPSTNTASLIAAWFDHVKREYSPGTQSAYCWAAVQFRDWLGERGTVIENVDIEVVRAYRDWMDAKGWKVSTMRSQVTALRAMFDWFHEQMPDAFPVNPVGKIRGLKVSREHKRDPLTNQEVVRLLEPHDGSDVGLRDRAILHLMAFCGLRAVEVRRAKRGDLHQRNSRNVLWVQGKGRDDADSFVVVPGKAWDAVSEWLRVGHQVYLNDRPLFYSLGNRVRGEELGARTVLHIVKRRMREAGIDEPRKTTHSLRHTAISNALLHGASTLQVQQMARHASFDTTMIYVHEIGRMQSPAEDFIAYQEAEEDAHQYVQVRR